jgi:S-DNA-T family DNA segregation ATPase FtsK/SpoIIIE
LSDLAALALALAGSGLLVALVSYDARDPSLNTATARATTNLLGPPGAYVSDILLQGFGMAGILPAICLLAWAWRIGSRRGLGSLLLRVAALLAALPVVGAVLTGALLVMAPAPAATVGWPAGNGPGGAAGRLVAADALAAGRDMIGLIGGPMVLTAGALLGTSLVVLALGLSPGVPRGGWPSAADPQRAGADAFPPASVAAPPDCWTG